jgi:hypothetical protein
MEVTMNKTTPAESVPSETKQAQVIERPDGFYWLDDLTGKEFGPFATLLEAQLDMEGQNESGYEEGESLEDAEEEIGISTWIDPETGEPAEDMSTRHSDD